MIGETGGLKARTAHVVCYDRVGHSRLSIEQQAKLTAELKAFVEALPEYAEALSDGEVIPIDSGDGNALVFFGDPQVAGAVALSISNFSRSQTQSKLRIGVHSGPVTVRTDLAGKQNVSGPGIDMANRVQSLATPDAVFLSSSIAEQLRAFETWRHVLIDEGTKRIKHEQLVHVFSVAGSGSGVPELNTKIAKDADSSVHVAHSWKVPRLLTVSVLGLASCAAILMMRAKNQVDWVVLYATSFDAPQFVLGPANGKDGWSTFPSQPQHSVVESEERVLRIDSQDGVSVPSGAWRGFNRSLSVSKVRLAFRMKIDDKLPLPSDFGYTMDLDLNSEREDPVNDVNLAVLYVGKANNPPTWCIQNPEYTEFVAPTPVGQWRTVTIEWSSESQQQTVSVDGQVCVRTELAGRPLRYIKLVNFFSQATKGTCPSMLLDDVRLDYIPRITE